MATTIPTKVSTPTDLRDWLRRVDALGELQTVRGANTEEDIGMATELLGRTRPSKATRPDSSVAPSLATSHVRSCAHTACQRGSISCGS